MADEESHGGDVASATADDGVVDDVAVCGDEASDSGGGARTKITFPTCSPPDRPPGSMLTVRSSCTLMSNRMDSPMSVSAGATV